MTTPTETLSTAEAAVRAGLSYQRFRQLTGRKQGPPSTRAGCGPHGGGHRFLAADVDAWAAARPVRVKRGAKVTPMNPVKQERLEAAGWKAGDAEDFLSANDSIKVTIAHDATMIADLMSDGLVTEAGGASFKALVDAVCGAPEFAALCDDSAVAQAMRLPAEYLGHPPRDFAPTDLTVLATVETPCDE